MPSPDETAWLLTAISKLRLYGVDPLLIRVLAVSNISIVFGVANGDIPSMATDPATVSRWLVAYVPPFVPATTISVGNKVLESADASLAAALLVAMQNIHTLEMQKSKMYRQAKMADETYSAQMTSPKYILWILGKEMINSSRVRSDLTGNR